MVIIKVDVIQQGWDTTTRLMHYQTTKIKRERERVKDEHKLVWAINGFLWYNITDDDINWVNKIAVMIKAISTT